MASSEIILLLVAVTCDAMRASSSTKMSPEGTKCIASVWPIGLATVVTSRRSASFGTSATRMFGALRAAAVVMSATQRMVSLARRRLLHAMRAVDGVLAGAEEALAVVCGAWRLAVLSFVSSRWSVVRNGRAVAICGSARLPTPRNSLRIYEL